MDILQMFLVPFRLYDDAVDEFSQALMFVRTQPEINYCQWEKAAVRIWVSKVKLLNV